jgi:hypothetical protein
MSNGGLRPLGDVVEPLMLLMRGSRRPRDVVEPLEAVNERLKASKRCC